MSKGKKAEFYDEAQLMYAEGLKNYTEIAAALRARGGPSTVSLREWSEWGDWPSRRKEYKKNVTTLSDTINEIAASRIRAIAEIHPGDLNTGHADELIKLQRVTQQHRDPRDELRIRTRAVRDFGKYVKENDPALAAQLPEAMIGYLSDMEERIDE